ncbi:uncharacterized protein LOC127358638 isoform X5 [Dicentrarchus labrax]|uniref:uncharacterized protein LOC127358638 isoform X5 n=1 Tax=Dicentrarchus labrax TaxID=13489 RepID=UPI0021F59940|nr:uncharacterized protein LOC127358638 isoform X5 [Dicentrarchus labrax]
MEDICYKTVGMTCDDICKDYLMDRCEELCEVAVMGGGTLAFVALLPVILALIGFTLGGSIVGSIAATIMSMMSGGILRVTWCRWVLHWSCSWHWSNSRMAVISYL